VSGVDSPIQAIDPIRNIVWRYD